MAKGGKFGALADFRKEQASDDVAAIGREIFEEAEVEEAAKVAEAAPLAPAPEPELPLVDAAISASAEPEARRRGRPAGKRSDPDWKLFSHFLRKRTQRRASLILTARDDGVDLSDVLEELLEGWVERNEGR